VGGRTAEPEVVSRRAWHQTRRPGRQTNLWINLTVKNRLIHGVVSCSNPAIALIWSLAFENN